MPKIVFQQAIDTMLQEKSQAQGFASAASLSVDDDNGSDTDNQVLLRFDDLQFDQIPDGATITKAILTLQSHTAPPADLMGGRRHLAVPRQRHSGQRH
jgi:hypothetical protein